jgi:hypothetical protein
MKSLVLKRLVSAGVKIEEGGYVNLRHAMRVLASTEAERFLASLSGDAEEINTKLLDLHKQGSINLYLKADIDSYTSVKIYTFADASFLFSAEMSFSGRKRCPYEDRKYIKVKISDDYDEDYEYEEDQDIENHHVWYVGVTDKKGKNLPYEARKILINGKLYNDEEFGKEKTLHIKGNFNSDFIGFKTLPREMKVDGNARIRSVAPPTKLNVAADLFLQVGKGNLPHSLKVGGTCTLLGEMKNLSPDLEVGEDLVLFNCTKIVSIPSTIKVGGSLDISWCESLVTVPTNFKVHARFNRCHSLTHLPEKMGKVEDCLYLADCKSLISLPDSLRVIRGSMILESNNFIKSLPRGLFRIDSFLSMKYCRVLESLSDALEVKGDLDLEGCHSLKSLPSVLKVKGNLTLRDCRALTFLPEGLEIGGDLDLSGSGVKEIPADLKVKGKIIQGDYKVDEYNYRVGKVGSEDEVWFEGSLTNLNDILIKHKYNLPGTLSCSGRKGLALPEGLVVQGSLILTNSGIESLPKGLEVGGKLDLEGCKSLKSLPLGLKVGRDLILTGCKSLKSLPPGLKVGKHLIFWSGCESLDSIHSGLQVGGDLDLEGNKSLKTLPSSLKVGGDLKLRSCTSLESLPSGLKVGGNLDLNDCRSLKSLSSGLKVIGNLNLSGCQSLKFLPPDLLVGGNLWLSGCTSLESLPPGLQVSGNLNLEGCKSLSSIPLSMKIGGHVKVRDAGCSEQMDLKNAYILF